jgi:hypothetical protein
MKVDYDFNKNTMKSICKIETIFVLHYKLNQQSHEHVFDDVKVGFHDMEINFLHILKPFYVIRRMKHQSKRSLHKNYIGVEATSHLSTMYKKNLA